MGNSPPRYEERDLLTKLSCSSETLALWGSDINTMAAIFAAADRDGDMTLSTRETRSALKALGIKPSKKTTQRYMSQLDTNLDGVLTFPELVTLVTAVDASQALLEVFHTCSGGGTEVSTQRLREFFAAQGTPMPSALGPSGAVSQADFTLLMHSEHNKWTVPEEDAVWQDMTQPLHHYFIESSHNTYLCGNQLWSSSSVQRYREVLAQGVRCIEMDVWDGKLGEPMVTHGHTLTGKIKARSVIQCIRDHGFASSPYPVIVSLENHCSPQMQAKLANHFVKILGNRLVTAAEAARATPESLRGRVIIKGKAGTAAGEDPQKSPAKVKPVDPALAAVIGLPAVKCADLDERVVAAQPNECSSFVESRAEELAADERFQELNRRCFSRVYPVGTRVGSTNFMESAAAFHGAGAQLVALNYQHNDLAVRMNRALFRANGACGYLLKPPHLRAAGAARAAPLTLELTVVSGHRLRPRPKRSEIPDPFVKVLVWGPEGAQEFETRAVEDNAWKPEWNETFRIAVADPGLTVLRLAVQDQDAGEGAVGEATAAVASLRNGYRIVHLTGPKGTHSGKLFVRLQGLPPARGSVPPPAPPPQAPGELRPNGPEHHMHLKVDL